MSDDEEPVGGGGGFRSPLCLTATRARAATYLQKYDFAMDYFSHAAGPTTLPRRIYNGYVRVYVRTYACVYARVYVRENALRRR